MGSSEGKKISIIAGNPLITQTNEGIEVKDPQIEAFEKAMKIVSGNKGKVNRVYVLFDHKSRNEESGKNEDFRELFCDPIKMRGLSKRKRKGSIKLSYLPDEHTKIYREMAEKYGVDFDDIRIISEGHLRADMQRYAKEDDILGKKVTRKCTKESCPQEDIGKEIINCKGITAAAVKRVDKGMTKDSEIYFIGNFDETRFRPEIIEAGSEIAKAHLGVRSKVKTTFLMLDSNEKYTDELNRNI